MRQFLAVAVLGATLAFGARTAFASDNVDYGVPFQPAQSVIVTQSESGSVVAGGSSAETSVQQLREENREH